MLLLQCCCALRKFHMTDGQNVHDQIALYAFHSFLVEVQMNGGYMCTRVITTWRLGLRALVVGLSCLKVDKAIHMIKLNQRVTRLVSLIFTCWV